MQRSVGKGEGQAQGYRLPPSNTNAIWRPEKLCWQTGRFTPRCTIMKKPWEWMLPTAEIFFLFAMQFRLCDPHSPPRPLAVKVGSPNHWTAKEFLSNTVSK